jgi:phospholipase A-2-activating protein
MGSHLSLLRQTLEHPSNLWGVAFLPSGDLVTACSDHVARVWTQDGQRKGPADLAQVGPAAVPCPAHVPHIAWEGGPWGSVRRACAAASPHPGLFPS